MTHNCPYEDPRCGPLRMCDFCESDFQASYERGDDVNLGSPKFWVELSDRTKEIGDHVYLIGEDVGATCIGVKLGSDPQAAKETLDRVRRIWNLMRDVKDDEFNEVIVISRENAQHGIEALKATLEDNFEAVLSWKPQGDRR